MVLRNQQCKAPNLWTGYECRFSLRSSRDDEDITNEGLWKGPFNIESDEIAKLKAHVAELQNLKILSGRGMAVGGASTNTSE